MQKTKNDKPIIVLQELGEDGIAVLHQLGVILKFIYLRA